MTLQLPSESTSPAPRFDAAGDAGLWVNDVHAQLNRTHVRRVCRPSSPAAAQRIVRQAKDEGAAISVAGGRHAMGGQQFGEDTVLVDTAPVQPAAPAGAHRSRPGGGPRGVSAGAALGSATGCRGSCAR